MSRSGSPVGRVGMTAGNVICRHRYHVSFAARLTDWARGHTMKEQ